MTDEEFVPFLNKKVHKEVAKVQTDWWQVADSVQWVALGANLSILALPVANDFKSKSYNPVQLLTVKGF